MYPQCPIPAVLLNQTNFLLLHQYFLFQLRVFLIYYCDTKTFDWPFGILFIVNYCTQVYFSIGFSHVVANISPTSNPTTLTNDLLNKFLWIAWFVIHHGAVSRVISAP